MEASMEPATEEALRAEIEATKRKAEAALVRGEELDAEITQANKRQKLRRELDEQKQRLATAEAINRGRDLVRNDIDADRSGMHLPGSVARSKPPSFNTGGLLDVSGGESTHCGRTVARGEYVWNITGFSWLPGMLVQQDDDPFLMSKPFRVGDEIFQFACNPLGDMVLWDPVLHGTLAILVCTDEQILLRYRILIKSSTRRGFVQWGETRQEFHDGPQCPDFACGPDVHARNNPPSVKGIFGLSFDQLLHSEWVENDTLTVKFVLEVRPNVPPEAQSNGPAVHIPGPTITRDTEVLLDKGAYSDMQFNVQGQVIRAHSQILFARSDVFEKQLTAGLQESVSKEIVIEDCDATTFKVFIKYLYTDNFPNVKDLLASRGGGQESPSQLSQMQALLSVSHKYQVSRLQRWCEKQLCQHLTTADVCDVLRQAHLVGAKHLEKACLAYIKGRMTEVAKQPAYAELMTSWPQIMLKVSLFMTGSETAGADAV